MFWSLCWSGILEQVGMRFHIGFLFVCLTIWMILLGVLFIRIQHRYEEDSKKEMKNRKKNWLNIKVGKVSVMGKLQMLVHGNY